MRVRGDETPREHQDAAIAVVWQQTYGRTEKPPAVEWITDLPCTDPNSGKRGFPVVLMSGQECREGYMLTPWLVRVAWHGGKFSDTALAHELMHAVQAHEGIADPLHRMSVWQPGGAVELANEALRAAGL